MAQGQTHAADGIPLPIVTLNRSVLVGGIVIAFVAQQPWITAVLVALLVPAVIGGQRWSPIARIGERLFAPQIAHAPREDRQLMRFNNSIALVLLVLAQIGFLAGAPVVGWALAGLVAIAASVALAGFCVGCFLFFQFKLNRTRLFGG